MRILEISFYDPRGAPTLTKRTNKNDNCNLWTSTFYNILNEKMTFVVSIFILTGQTYLIQDLKYSKELAETEEHLNHNIFVFFANYKGTYFILLIILYKISL